jgi:hypothetical protein
MLSASFHKYAYIIVISAEDVDQLLHLGKSRLEHPLDVILYARNHLSRKFPFPGHVAVILINL